MSLTLFCLGYTELFAQVRSENEVYAAMIFNFTKYIQWPDESESGDFVIGIWGNEELYKSLKTYDGKPKNSKKYFVKLINNLSDVSNCRVIFLSPSKNQEFENVKSLVSGKPVLTVTAAEGYGKRGSCINFKQVNEKIRFELNQNAVSSSSLKVSNALTVLSIPI
ncbi:MAG: YfiR family protein [Cyclobacteriaceae bacterium]